MFTRAGRGLSQRGAANGSSEPSGRRPKSMSRGGRIYRMYILVVDYMKQFMCTGMYVCIRVWNYPDPINDYRLL